MMDSDYRLTFAVMTEEIPETPKRDFASDQISVTIEEATDELVIGDYTFESDPQFGSSSTATGYVVLDKETNLVAVTTQNDRPKSRQIFEGLGEALEVSFRMPNIDPEDQYSIYREYSYAGELNGFTISFKENSETFDITDSMGLTMDPEREAEERSKHTQRVVSRDHVDEIAEKAMNDGMYIWSSDLSIEDYNLSFSDPIRFYGIGDEFLDDLGFEKLFGIARNAIDS